MNEADKLKIKELRIDGASYGQIAALLNLSVNTVKSYCQRNQLGGNHYEAEYVSTCRNCGAPIVQIPRRKRRRFCTDDCRKIWWKTHPDALDKKAVYSFICANCGEAFTSYGNAGRKYCSHACYTNHRFKKPVKP